VAYGRAEAKTDDIGDSVSRVLLVDDHDVLRAGTRQVLETSTEIVVVGEAEDGLRAITMVEDLEPDVVLIDIRLPDRNGIDVARQLAISHPSTRVVIFSAYDDSAFVRAALGVGVVGYLLKTMSRDDLVKAVVEAGRGTTVLAPALSELLARQRTLRARNRQPALTRREEEVVELVAQGLTNRAIADRLGVSVRTAEGHLNHARSKLGVESRTELVRLVLRYGAVSVAQASETEP